MISTITPTEKAAEVMSFDGLILFTDNSSAGSTQSPAKDQANAFYHDGATRRNIPT